MELPLTPPSVAGEMLPLSLSQREVWLDQMAWPGSSHLNIGGCGFIIGPFDPERFHAALRILVDETEALRLTPLADGRQFLLSSHVPELPEFDFSATADPGQAMQSWWQEKLQEAFPADGKPPWRFALLKGGEEFHALIIQFHHLIMDGWGTTQIIRRWSTLYNDLADGAACQNDNRANYRQFIAESAAYRHSPAFDKDGEFWLARLPEAPPPLIEHRHDARRDGLPPARIHAQKIARQDYLRLGQFAGERGHTPFAVFLAAIACYFARSRNRTRVTIGVPTLNRGGKRYLATPGMFVSVMPITLKVGPGETAENLVTAVQRTLREAMRHSRYPLGELTRRLNRLRDQRNGLFDVLVSYERQDYSITFGSARSAGSRQLFPGIARYPLGITLCEFATEQEPAQDPELILEGSMACFNNGEVELLARRLWHLVRSFLAYPGQAAASFDLMPAEERWALLDGLHQNVSCHTDILPFVTLFEHQARLRPDAVALTWQGGSMSYGELERRSRLLAGRLSRYVNGKDTVIAMALERDAGMVISLLAIARAGAAFLPLDPEAPAARLRHILAASGAAALLIQSRNRERLAALHEHTLDIESLPATHGPANDPLPTPLPGDSAYVLYTSGSTGEPKGVMIEHGALARRLAWLSATYRVTWTDRSAQATQITFDPALIEICLPLIHGASVALPPPGRLSARKLADFVLAQGVTIMAFVPSTLERFLDALGDLPPASLKLRVACSGGEILPAELANRYLKTTGAQLFNVYGPTETAIFATAWPCQTTPAGTTLPVGRPVDDTRIYILDEQLRLLPFGERGEICIGGGAVARGYLGHHEPDRQAFRDDPFVTGGRIYRTGDAGWLSCDGHLHFAGRLDRQIKLRGYRIEPGEIESALLALDGVSRAAVKTLAREGQQALHAWVVAAPRLDENALQGHLRQTLPDYMVPAGFSLLPSLPETATGKIDYAVLPAPTFSRSATPPRPPAPGLETTLVELWSRVLKKAGVGVTDNFFAIGGDSLAAIDIIAGIEAHLGNRVPLHLITANPTIESLARTLGTAPQKTPSLLRLGGTPGLPPLFLVASGHGDLLRFQALAAALARAFDLHMLQPPDDDAPRTLGDLAELYAGQVHRLGNGPVHVAGFSVGGVTALETAHRLRARGIDVSRLILIDTLYPNAFLRARKLWQLSGWLIRRLHIQELSMNGRRLGALFSDTGLVLQVEALAHHVPTTYDGPTLLIKSSGLLAWQRWLFRPWQRLLTGPLTEWDTPGLHGSLFEPDNLAPLARLLESPVDAP